MGTNFVLCILGRELFSWVRMWVGVFLGSGERERCLVLSEKKKTVIKNVGAWECVVCGRRGMFF